MSVADKSKNRQNVSSEDMTPVELLEWTEAASHGTGKRIREIVSILVFEAIVIVIFLQLHSQWRTENSFAALTVTILIAAFLADWASGFIHWFFDTWGTIDTHFPLFGNGAFRLFREHHIDATFFTHRDWIVTWGEICMIGVPIMGAEALALITLPTSSVQSWYYWHLCYAIFCFLLAANNQFHKWAHTVHYPLPFYVEWLQKLHIFLPKTHHNVHHRPPHMVRYCVVNGWANYPLDYIGFWRKVEWLVQTITGHEPRCDDMKWTQKLKKQRLAEGILDWQTDW